MKKIISIFMTQIRKIKQYTNRSWYGPLIGFLAAIDNIILIVPTDGLLISSVMLQPKRWLWFGLCLTAGSVLGAALLITLVEWQGLPWILHFYPGLNQTALWEWTHQFFELYGLLLVFAVAVTPVAQQPAVVLAALAEVSVLKLCAVILAGRLIKFFILSYVASHAPRLLSKMWGIKDEMQEVGLK